VIQWGSFYVALTRVREGKNVFLKSFEPCYVTFNKKVEEKIQAMRKFRPYKFKKKYLFDKIFMDNDEIKLGYLNIRGLFESNHSEYLDNDKNLLYLDLLVVAETWLNNELRK
jgi:hypothetical protein